MENTQTIFALQKLTDMVPTKKIFRAWPPVGPKPSGDTANDYPWWEF